MIPLKIPLPCQNEQLVNLHESPLNLFNNNNVNKNNNNHNNINDDNDKNNNNSDFVLYKKEY